MSRSDRLVARNKPIVGPHEWPHLDLHFSQACARHQTPELTTSVAVAQRLADEAHERTLDAGVRRIDRQRGPVGVGDDDHAAGFRHTDHLANDGVGMVCVLQHALAVAAIERTRPVRETCGVGDQI